MTSRTASEASNGRREQWPTVQTACRATAKGKSNARGSDQARNLRKLYIFLTQRVSLDSRVFLGPSVKAQPSVLDLSHLHCLLSPTPVLPSDQSMSQHQPTPLTAPPQAVHQLLTSFPRKTLNRKLNLMRMSRMEQGMG